MLKLWGPSALSDFKKRQLLSNLKKHVPAVTSVDSQFIHFLDSPKLNETELNRLDRLLNYDQPSDNTRSGSLFLVVPRFGTISPWSSKATDILHNCGLNKVKRIERGTANYIKSRGPLNAQDRKVISQQLYDRMTQTLIRDLSQALRLFSAAKPKPFATVNILQYGYTALEKANRDYGMALADDEIDYLVKSFKKLSRNPTDVELMMFAQANSEHSRHKIFNANWIVDRKPQPKSLFQMIKNTYQQNSQGILSAYSDNAAVMQGTTAGRFFANSQTKTYGHHKENIDILMKVETHNHPSAIAPYPGAATGSGGEIRDAAATGKGAKPKAGLIGFSVSDLKIPGFKQPWESSYGGPSRIRPPLDIMIEGPLGGAGYNNEYGRPAILGYFRTFEQEFAGETRGYHKPIVIAGGIGNIRRTHVSKARLATGTKLVVLGGPAMLIGLGGAAGSSMAVGTSDEDLDFASVQRDNAEIQRRAQEVIDQCWAMGKNNPILSIHDVGAGGFSNAFPELVHNSSRGGRFELRAIDNAEPGMSPMEIWSNEAQERYVLAIANKRLASFKQICRRERCPAAVVGTATKTQGLSLKDRLFKNRPIDIPLDLLFGKPPKMQRQFTTARETIPPLRLPKLPLTEVAERVLKLPTVSSKQFLITIGDRTVGGQVARDQMVGPWQVPVADTAVTTSAFDSYSGEAMAMGERTPLALTNAPASGRMAIGEAITNIAAADIAHISDIKLSANWMMAAGHGSEDQKLFETVKAVAMEFCPSLGLTIPVGKDSLSMQTVWHQNGKSKKVIAPLSLIITGFAKVKDVRRTQTPQLRQDQGQTDLMLVDLGGGQQRLGGSALAQVFNQVGGPVPDADGQLLKKFFKATQNLNRAGLLLAYHDRSDGGLFTTVCEMAFAGHTGIDIRLDKLAKTREELAGALFNEELGAVIQVKRSDRPKVLEQFRRVGLAKNVCAIGQPNTTGNFIFSYRGKRILQNSRIHYQRLWAETSYRIQALRDNPKTAKQEFDRILEAADPGLNAKLPFATNRRGTTSFKARPQVAVLREQGVNGQLEMAAAFDRAGFDSVDVHMSDIIAGRVKLERFEGLAACGGFSYGDVLGGGGGWAKSILFNSRARDQFQGFFNRSDTFSLGVCNGCQMFSQLKELIPGSRHWPRFVRNYSDRFEARVTLVKVLESPSILFKDMGSSVIPIPTAHGEGQAEFATKSAATAAIKAGLVSLQFVDNYHQPTEVYPANPNGSTLGITGLTTEDGRATIIMPHPERVFRTVQHSWHPDGWGENSPWLKLFQNARAWVS